MIESQKNFWSSLNHDHVGHLDHLINSHSRIINGRTTAMTINQFDQLDRPIRTAYDFVVSAARASGETAGETSA